MKSFIFLILLLITIINCQRCSKKVHNYIMKECGKNTNARKEKGKWMIGCGISDDDYSITKKRIVKNTKENSGKIASWENQKLKSKIEPELKQCIKKNKIWKPHEYDALCIFGLKGNSITDIFKNFQGDKKKIESQLPSPEKEIFNGSKKI